MLRLLGFVGFALVAAAVLVVAGCSSPENSQDKADNNPDNKSSADDEAAKIEKGLAGLSDEDRALAEAQEFCPVGGGKLGLMGTPVKIEDVQGRDVFLCCHGCEADLRKDPDKYLAKLKKD